MYQSLLLLLCTFSHFYYHTVCHADTCLYCKQQGTRARMAYCYLNKLILSILSILSFGSVPYIPHLPNYRPTHVTGYNHKGAAILPVPVTVHHPAYHGYNEYRRPINENTVAKTLLYSLLLSQVLRLSG